MALYFFSAFIAAGILNFICSILILRGMAKAGVKISFFELRWQVHKHLKDYRKICSQNNEKDTWPYYAYQGSLVGMIGFAILTILFLSN